MRILFDQGVPHPLRDHLGNHLVETCAERGWTQLDNGDLLHAAEQAGFELFVTTDQSPKYQQNLAGRQLAILVLLSTSWPKIQLRLGDLQRTVSGLQPASYVEFAV